MYLKYSKVYTSQQHKDLLQSTGDASVFPNNLNGKRIGKKMEKIKININFLFLQKGVIHITSL